MRTYLKGFINTLSMRQGMSSISVPIKAQSAYSTERHAFGYILLGCPCVNACQATWSKTRHALHQLNRARVRGFLSVSKTMRCRLNSVSWHSRCEIFSPSFAKSASCRLSFLRKTICTKVRTYLEIRMYVHTGPRTYIHAYIHAYIHTYIRTFTHAYTHAFKHTYIHM